MHVKSRFTTWRQPTGAHADREPLDSPLRWPWLRFGFLSARVSYGFLFSIPEQVESLRQMQRGLVERQAMNGRPEIQDIAVHGAIRLEALKDVLSQMNRERSLAILGLSVHRARSTPLRATAAQVLEQTEVFEDLLQADLLTHEGEVHTGPGHCHRID